MKKEIIKIQGNENDRPFHLLVTRESTDQEDLDEVVVAFMMSQEQRLTLIEHLANIADKKGVVGFTITFGIKTTLDPDDGLRVFSESIKRM